jgi:hypothetical protein
MALIGLAEEVAQRLARIAPLPTVRWPLLALLSLSGFLIVVASSIGQSIDYVPPVEFGLFAVLPATYYVGIGLMALSMMLGFNSKSEACFFMQALLLFLAIWGARFLFTANPTIWDSYMHYFSSLRMIETGTTIGEGIYSYSSNYPGFFLLGATFGLMAQPDVLAFLQYWPMFTVSITTLSMYLFVRTYLHKVDMRIALLVILLGNVWLAFHYSPQSLGLAIGLLVFVFLEKKGFYWLILALAAFTFVTISHPTTGFFIMLALIGRQVLMLFRNMRTKGLKREISWPVIELALIWGAWLVTGAQQYSIFLSDLVASKILYIFYVPEATGQAIVQRTSGNLWIIGPYLRLVILGTLGLLVIVAIYLHYFGKERKERKELPGAILALSILSIAIVPLDIFFLQGQLYDRGFLYFVLAATVLVAFVVFQRRTTLRKVAVVLLALAAVTACTSLFYQDSLMTVSTESIAMSDFIDEHMPFDSWVAGGVYPDIVWKDSNWTSFIRVQYYVTYNDTFSNWTAAHGSTGMIFDQVAVLWMTQWGQLYIYDFYLDDARNQTKVYDNGACIMIYGR